MHGVGMMTGIPVHGMGVMTRIPKSETREAEEEDEEEGVRETWRNFRMCLLLMKGYWDTFLVASDDCSKVLGFLGGVSGSCGLPHCRALLAGSG